MRTDASQPVHGCVQEIVVADTDVERLMAAGVARAVFPQIDLDDGMSPRGLVAHPPRVAESLAGSAVHDVAVHERPQQTHFLDAEVVLATGEQRVPSAVGCRIAMGSPISMARQVPR